MEHGRNLKTAKEYRDMFKATFVRKSRSQSCTCSCVIIKYSYSSMASLLSHFRFLQHLFRCVLTFDAGSLIAAVIFTSAPALSPSGQTHWIPAPVWPCDWLISLCTWVTRCACDRASGCRNARGRPSLLSSTSALVYVTEEQVATTLMVVEGCCGYL